MNGMRLSVNQKLHAKGATNRNVQIKGSLPNFDIRDFVLVAGEGFTASEKLARRWHGPRRARNAFNPCLFHVEDLRSGTLEEIHGSRLKCLLTLL